jgi:RNA-directed DNA polymerase
MPAEPPEPPPPPPRRFDRPGNAVQVPATPSAAGKSPYETSFTPVSGAQAHAEANKLPSPPLWERRDRIPSSEDARTLLIDRAMVAQGLIAPEELQRIHDAGHRMDELRPTWERTQELAKHAVTLDKEQRAAIKAQKKAESAERKRLRAEQVGHRRATDIIFLGRGVSAGLADRRSNVEKLAGAGLPVLSTPADVAKALEVTIPQLRWLAFHSESATVSHYVRFNVPKRSGGTRQLAAPHEHLKRCQEWVLANVLSKVAAHEAAHGFVPGRSTVTNARPHLTPDVLVNADLTDFFPTINVWRVKGFFESLGYSPAASTIFALLCTEAPRRQATYGGKVFYVAAGVRALPQGACTSPALSNLISRKMDARMRGIARKMNWTYTRYADDISLSCRADPSPKIGYMLARLRHIAQDEGFAVNEKKTRVLRKHRRQSVTGVVVNADAPRAPRDVVRQLRAILHNAKKTGLAAQNREKRPHFEAWLRGMIAYVHGVNPAQADRLKRELDGLGGSRE